MFFSFFTFTTSIYPSFPSSCILVTASPLRGLAVWRVPLMHAQDGMVWHTQALKHTGIQILHKNTNTLSQNQANKSVMKY